MGAHSPLLVPKHEIVQVTLIYQESGSMNDGGQEPVLDYSWSARIKFIGISSTKDEYKSHSLSSSVTDVVVVGDVDGWHKNVSPQLHCNQSSAFD